MNGPHHLAQFNILIENGFLEAEKIYRRCPFGHRTPPYSITDMFLDIQWDKDLLNGLSVNRSKFSKPEDVLWAFVLEDKENKICSYQEKKGLVYSSETKTYPVTDLKTGVTFNLSHTPTNCNISHCDITVANIPNNITKATKREIKAFLSTLFSEISDSVETNQISSESPHQTDIIEKNKSQDNPAKSKLGKIGCLIAIGIVIIGMLLAVLIINLDSLVRFYEPGK